MTLCYFIFDVPSTFSIPNKQAKVKNSFYECDTCDYMSTTALTLTKHNNTKHVIVKQSECSMCEEKFDNYNE